VTDVRFQIVDVVPERHAAVPTLLFGLQVEERSGAAVDIALRCQIRIEPQRRRYSPVEEQRLLELFGETPRWGDTLKPFLWTNVSALLPQFQGSLQTTLPVPCSYDFDVAAAKYFHALEDGEIPLVFLFSGTIFAQGETRLQVAQIPWNADATFRLPVRAWRALMDLYFPNGGWLRLRRESLDGLMRFKATRAIPTWDAVVDTLLKEAGTP